MDLQGKTIVITGAAQGLGQKMAQMIASHGAKLALVDLDHVKLQDTVRLCEAAGAKVKDYPTDVTEEATVEALFNSVHKDFGGVDGVINNAGITSDSLLVKVQNGKVQKKMSVDDFHKVIAVDLRGVFLCGREGAAHMIEGGRGGVIINISSISRAGNVGQTNYSAGKAGVAAMTVTWAKELARYKIRVAGIAPGFTFGAGFGSQAGDMKMKGRHHQALVEKHAGWCRSARPSSTRSTRSRYSARSKPPRQSSSFRSWSGPRPRSEPQRNRPSSISPAMRLVPTEHSHAAAAQAVGAGARPQGRGADEGQPPYRRIHGRDRRRGEAAHRPAHEPRLRHRRAGLSAAALRHRRRDQHLPDARGQARHRPERHRPGARARHRRSRKSRSSRRSRPSRQKIKSTLDAAALCKMADRGQITGGILDGPLAFDNAVSEEAAKTKGIVSPVAGQADIFVVPDLEAGNMLAKQLEYLAEARDRRHRARRARADHPDQPRRQDARAARLLRDRAAAGAPQGGGEAMSDAILVLNAGSSSIKFSLFPGDVATEPSRTSYVTANARASGTACISRRRTAPERSLVDEHLAEGRTHEDALAALLRWLEGRFQDHRLVAAGHRVVHGGSLYNAPVRIDAAVIAELTPPHSAGAAPSAP